MGEEVRMMEFDSSDGGDAEGVMKWEEGLPGGDDLTPLSQPLISLELASAFRITPEPSRTMVDVNRASESTLWTLHGGSECSDSRKVRRVIVEEGSEVVPAVLEETDSENANSNNLNSHNDGKCAAEDFSGVTKAIKKARLVWTPQLHKRFVDVVARLGIKHAVPKTIMQLMNVEGLTRENVASHLQKYRLYLKRMQDGPASGPPENLFTSTQMPQALHESGRNGHGSNGRFGMRIQMAYQPSQMMPMLMFHEYNDMVQQKPMDWPGNRCGSVATYHHLARNDDR